MAVKASAIQHKCSFGQSPIPVVTIHRFTELIVPIFQRNDTGILKWSGTVETETGKKKTKAIPLQARFVPEGG